MTLEQPETIAVFGASGSRPGDGHYEAGVLCGRLLAEAGYGVATGGYGGTMEAVSLGANQAGGHVIGITAPSVFPGREGVNQHVHEERETASIVNRIGELVDTTAGAMVLWGSIGTAAEMILAWNDAYVAPLADRSSKPIIAVGEPWTDLIPHLEMTLRTDPGFVTVAPDVSTGVGALLAQLRPDQA